MLGSILSLRYCLSDWTTQPSSQFAVLHMEVNLPDLFSALLSECLHGSSHD